MNFKQIECLNYRAIARLTKDPLYRNSFFMAISCVFNAACGLFFWAIAARIYTVEQVGLATALISSLGLVILFSRLGFDFSIIRFFCSEDSGRIISTGLIVTTVASIIAGIVYILLAELLAPSMQFLKEPAFALSFLLIGAVISVAGIIGNSFIADRKADCYLYQNLFMAFRIPALVPVASLGVLGILGSVGLGNLIGSFYGLFVLQRSIKSMKLHVDRDIISRSFRFSSWNYASSTLSVAPTLIIPIMVLNMLGEAEAARYYMAFAIGNLVLIIPSSLGTSLFVEGSHGEGLKKCIMRAAIASLVLQTPIVLVLFFFGDQLLGLLNEEYVEAFELMKIIVISSFPVAIYSLFVPIQNVRIRMESIVGLNMLRFALLLGLSYALMQRYGTLGAGYAWIATYGVIVLVIGYIGWREK